MFDQQYLNFDRYCSFIQEFEASVTRKKAFYKLCLFIDFARSRSKSNCWLCATIWPRDYVQHGVHFNCAGRVTNIFKPLHWRLIHGIRWVNMADKQYTKVKCKLTILNSFWWLLSSTSILIVIVHLFKHFEHQYHGRRHSKNCVCSSILPDHGQSLFTGSASGKPYP